MEQNPKDIEEQSTMLVSLYGSIDSLDTMIADICALKNVNTIKDHYETVVDASGTFNIPKMWGLKKKLNLNSSDVPTAKKDKDGNLITTKNGLLALYKTTYIERLSHNSIKPEYETLKTLKEKLFELRLEISSKTKSEDWEVKEIETVCKSLKSNKARHEYDLIYELFKQPFAGSDIFESLTKLFNLIKKELTIPDFFELMSITSLWKSKGSRNELSNDRGIFNVSKVRSIFDKVIYSDGQGNCFDIQRYDVMKCELNHMQLII